MTTNDSLVNDLYQEILRIPLIDPHTHINPHSPTARTLDDILGYHYYTELAHSAGMSQEPLASSFDPRERVRALLGYMPQLDNTVQYSWFLEIARVFLNFQGDHLSAADTDTLWTTAERIMSQPDWEDQVLKRSNLEKVFLTNEFDDQLEGFDTNCYVPCLRTDDLVFGLHKPEVRERLARSTGVEVGDANSLRQAIQQRFQYFTQRQARACAISLPPDFEPHQVDDGELSRALLQVKNSAEGAEAESLSRQVLAPGVFWILAEHCRSFRLPFDLMIGVLRRVYQKGVHQGQDLFDGRTSLIQYARLFNAFPEVPFCISVLSTGQNQELASFSWIFPNVVTSGHWWYSNIPVHIERDTRARLQAVPKTKQIGYYSDMYKLEFALPKYNMYRRILARILADDFVRPGTTSEQGAVQLARLLLRENVERIFDVST